MMFCRDVSFTDYKYIRLMSLINDIRLIPQWKEDVYLSNKIMRTRFFFTPNLIQFN